MGPSGPNPAARPLGPGYLPYPRPFYLSPRAARRMVAAAGVAAAAGTGAIWVHHHEQHHRQPQQQRATAAAPPGALSWLLPPSNSSQQHPQHQQQQQQGSQQPQLLLPQAVTDMLCGAIAEMVSVAVLYPLDTIKVRCQAAGLGVGAVVRQLATSRSLTSIAGQLYAGVWSASTCSVFIGSLYYYSFCEAKRLATRFVAGVEARNRHQAATHPGAPAASSSSSSSSSSRDGGNTQGHLLGVAAACSSTVTSNEQDISCAQPREQQQQQHLQPHLHSGPAVDYHHDSVLAVICSDNSAAAAVTTTTAAVPGSNSSSSSSSSSSTSADAMAQAAPSSRVLQQPASSTPPALSLGTGVPQPAAGAAQLQGEQAAARPTQQQQQPLVISDHGRAVANLMAAAAAAVVGAVVEAPMELFKHRMQAGQVSGSMFGAMASAWRAGGPAALYWGFLPFLAKSLPYDMGELNSYSSMQDWRDGAKAAAGTQGSNSSVAVVSHSDSSSNPVRAVQAGLLAMPDGGWDLLVGAAAGATAVLLSMPTDCIKTVMETGGGVPVAPGGGMRATTAAFLATGRQLVARHGPQGLFIGIVPRLLEQVPSTMLYFGAVGACRRLLAPVTQPQEQQVEAALNKA